MIMNENFTKKLIESDLVIENDFFQAYVDLIISNKDNIKEPGREKHHIIPKSLYKMLGEPVNNKKENLVYLSRIDHIKAHYYLALASSGVLKAHNAYATVCLTRTATFKDAEKLILHDLTKLQELFEVHNCEVAKRRRGYVWSTESREKLSCSLKASQKNKGKNNSMWGIHRTSPTKGLIAVNNGEKQQMIEPTMLNDYLKRGFSQGGLPRKRLT